MKKNLSSVGPSTYTCTNAKTLTLMCSTEYRDSNTAASVCNNVRIIPEDEYEPVVLQISFESMKQNNYQLFNNKGGYTKKPWVNTAMCSEYKIGLNVAYNSLLAS